MLRTYRRSIARAALKKRGDKRLNKKVAFEDGDQHKSVFSRIFSEIGKRKEG
jgi:hypothetical protein